MSNISDTEIEQKIINYVHEHEGVSFVELEELLADDIETEGDGMMVSPADDNVYFWVNMSDRFLDAVIEVFERGDIHMHPCHPFVYHVDGKVPRMDVAKQPPADGYVSERWYPVSFCSYPVEERDDWPEEGGKA